MKRLRLAKLKSTNKKARKCTYTLLPPLPFLLPSTLKNAYVHVKPFNINVLPIYRVCSIFKPNDSIELKNLGKLYCGAIIRQLTEITVTFKDIWKHRTMHTCAACHITRDLYRALLNNYIFQEKFPSMSTTRCEFISAVKTWHFWPT